MADDAKFYGVRHAFGTRAIVNGVDIKTLSLLTASDRRRDGRPHVAVDA